MTAQIPRRGIAITCNGTEVTPGVIPGGSAPCGHYVGLAVVQEALGLGWHDTWAQAAAETYDEHHSDPDWVHGDVWPEIVTDAEAWLNEHTTMGMWSWSDGDFRLDAIEACPWCHEFRFADPDVRGDDDPCDGEHLARY